MISNNLFSVKWKVWFWSDFRFTPWDESQTSRRNSNTWILNKHTFITTIVKTTKIIFVNYIHSSEYRKGTVTNRSHQLDPEIDLEIEALEPIEHPFWLVVFFGTFSWPSACKLNVKISLEGQDLVSNCINLPMQSIRRRPIWRSSSPSGVRTNWSKFKIEIVKYCLFLTFLWLVNRGHIIHCRSNCSCFWYSFHLFNSILNIILKSYFKTKNGFQIDAKNEKSP